MKRRLMALVGLSALALSQVIPVSATNDFMTYSYCHGQGNSTSAPVSSAWTQNQTASSNCYGYLQMNWYDPVGGTYVPKPAKFGTLAAGAFYYDSIGINTSLNTYHRIGISAAAYDPGFTYS